MASRPRYHYDIDYRTPDGVLKMAQTLSYFAKMDATIEKDELVENLQKDGCTDIKPYLREVRVYWPYTQIGE